MDTNPKLQQRLRVFGIGCSLFAFIVGAATGMGLLLALPMGLNALYLMTEWNKHRHGMRDCSAGPAGENLSRTS